MYCLGLEGETLQQTLQPSKRKRQFSVSPYLLTNNRADVFFIFNSTIIWQAIAGLNGMQLGDKKLTVQLSCSGERGPGFPNMPVPV